MPAIIARLVLSMALVAYMGTSPALLASLAYADLWYDSGLTMATIAFVHLILAMGVWLLIWVGCVEWTERRRVGTVMSFFVTLAIWGLIVVGLIILEFGYSDGLEMVIGGSPFLPFFGWLAATCVIWVHRTEGKSLDTSVALAGEARCPQCGYSLARLTSTQCPECGHAATVDQVVGHALIRHGHLKAVLSDTHVPGA